MLEVPPGRVDDGFHIRGMQDLHFGTASHEPAKAAATETDYRPQEGGGITLH